MPSVLDRVVAVDSQNHCRCQGRLCRSWAGEFGQSQGFAVHFYFDEWGGVGGGRGYGRHPKNTKMFKVQFE